MSEQTLPPEPSLLSRAERVLLAVLRRKRLIALAYVPLSLLAVGAVLLRPPTYYAAGKVLLTVNRLEVSTSPNQPTELQRSGQVPEVELRTQLEILRSRDLVEAALAQLDPSPPSGYPSEPQGMARLLGLPRTFLKHIYGKIHGVTAPEPDDPRYWEVLDVQERLVATSVSKSNVIEVGFLDPNPSWARDFVNTLMDLYVDRYSQLQQISEAEEFFTEQSQLLRTKLAESEEELRKARERAGVLAGEQAEILARLNEFSAELARVRIARLEQEERVRYLERLQSGAERGRIAPPALVELEARRAELTGRYREDSERVRAIDAQIARLRKALSGYEAVGAGAAGEGGDPAVNLVAARASLAALKGREEALERERAAYQSQAEFLEARVFDISRLERQAKLDEEAYLSYVRTAEKSRLSNALEQSKLLRLRIIERAQLPVVPTGAQKASTLLWGLLGALVVAIAVGVVRDFFDPRVKTPEEVTRVTRLEVLALIPPRG